MGATVRVPVLVRVRRRLSDEGGSDIDLVKALEDARSDAGLDKYKARTEATRAERGRSEWVEEV